MEITKELIFSYLSGKSSALQKRIIDEWTQDPAHEEMFYKWVVEFETQQPQYAADLEKAVLRFRDFATQQTAQTGTVLGGIAEEEVPTSNPNWGRWLAAASLLFGLFLGGYLFRATIFYETYQTAFGQTQTLQLDDGSRVTLNANSSLRVPRFGFGSRTREVFLRGEAEFSVKHTIDNQQFVVKTARQFEVVVLGTEFTVYSRERGAKVVLNKGKVQLRYQVGQVAKQIMMKPGDLVLIDPQNQLKKRTAPEPERLAAWKEHRFVFEETTLEEITHLFAENFGINITIANPDMAQWTVSGSFAAQNAEELLDILTEAANLKYQKDGNNVLIFSE